MRQADVFVIVYRDGTARLVGGKSLERLLRGGGVFGFWRVWLAEKDGDRGYGR